jgi:ADP-heptose:LPS heptosyltransferase
MPLKNSPVRIALIKLAAIGDVVMACRALSEIVARYEVDLEVHWVIDEKLQPLARRLLSGGFLAAPFQVYWYPIESTRLFQGTRREKISAAWEILRTVAEINPRCAVILHPRLAVPIYITLCIH